MDLEGLHRLVLHVDVPNLDGEVVARHDVAPTIAEAHVRDGRDDFREERLVRRVLFLFKR